MIQSHLNRNNNNQIPIGWWRQGQVAPVFDIGGLMPLVQRVRQPLHIVKDSMTGKVGLARGGFTYPYTRENSSAPKRYELLGTLASLYPEWLGDRSFQEVHDVRFPYIAGEMANGIASTEMVIKAGKAGLLGFFGAAGLPLSRVESAIQEMKSALDQAGIAYGVNLIHNPHNPEMEEQSIDLFLKYRVNKVSASAFMQLSPAIVRYASTGLKVDQRGYIVRENHVFAKLSRPEVAKQFMSPAPSHMLSALVQSGKLTEKEAELAALIPVAEDITVEADSGGHTDNRPLTALFPTILDLRNRLSAANAYTRPIRVGAGGGIGSPSAAAAAFALGAAYIVTGSVNQAAVESGMSSVAKKMLAEAGIADVVMAPSSDMFELGVKVQVLKRGSMFSSRAMQLYELYKTYDSLEDIPLERRKKVEKEVFKSTFEKIWEETRMFFANRDASQLEKADRNDKHKMALVFRWYLGNATRWAIHGIEERRQDYQIWCGPAIGAFNTWVEGSFLEKAQERNVIQIAYNILEGAAIISRAQQLRTYGLPLSSQSFHYSPQRFVTSGKEGGKLPFGL